LGMCLMLANLLMLADMTGMISLAGVILVVAIGLGAVIFVHELGHFLVAKACGVKCEKFMIGFDIGGYKLSRKWGETEYGIGILPLGGYVKMLGQDDDPAHIADEMKRCEVSAGSPDAVEVTGPNGEHYYVDRRSYLAKSVPQRMAIISAGVVMNVIFAFIFAAIAYGMGVKYMPCIVSETVPGSPAWRAGLETGDEIVKIGDRKNPTFTQLKGGVTLGDMDNGIPVVVHRAADGEEVELTLKPEQSQGRGLATIGILSPFTVTFREGLPAYPDSPAAAAKAVNPPADVKVSGFQGGDTVIRVGNTPISDYREFAAALARDPSEPLEVTVKRTAMEEKPELAGKESVATELTFEVPPRPMRSLGLVMKMGPITAVQVNSPAAAAGLKAGDVITAVDGQSLSAAKSADDWEPDTLPERMRQAAAEGKSVAFSVLRDGKPIVIQVTPRIPDGYYSRLPDGSPVGVPSLGIAYQIGNRVEAVVPRSPAAEAQIKPGDTIDVAKFSLPENADSEKQDPITFRFAPNPPSKLPSWIRWIFGGEESPPPAPNPYWPAVVDTLQYVPVDSTLQLTVERGDEKLVKKLTPVAASDLFVTDRGFLFNPIERIRRATSVAEQVEYGWDETTDALGMVFRFLKKIGTQVPVTALGGPITIAKAAGYSAYEGLPALLVFLTMLSANLAVLNFLPIPLLDGGHMAFLAYEGVRGRPASEKFVVALHTVGFVFIVSLMLFVVSLDLGWIDRGL
jgi:regulator of sigma E protease